MRIPALSCPALPVSSLTHSRTTDGAVSAAAESCAELGVGGGLAVVTTSSWSIVGVFCVESGKARFDRLGARVEPNVGAMYCEKLWTRDGGRRYAFILIRSER